MSKVITQLNYSFVTSLIPLMGTTYNNYVVHDKKNYHEIIGFHFVSQNNINIIIIYVNLTYYYY